MTEDFDAHARIAELLAEIEGWRDNVLLLLKAHDKTLDELHAAQERVKELELLSGVACDRIRELERTLVTAGDTGE